LKSAIFATFGPPYDLNLDLGSGHMAHLHASLMLTDNLYLHTKFRSNLKNFLRIEARMGGRTLRQVNSKGSA